MEAVTTQAQAALGTRGERTSSAMAEGSSDYETFLKMLTVQMQNQDPLNPVEASDFAAQLAAFSSVEQQVLTNDLLASIKTRLATSDFAALADWVGMDVRSLGAAYFDGNSIETSGQIDTTAEKTDLVVRDVNGLEIYRAPVADSDGGITWMGETTAGQRAPNGLYSLSLEGFSSGESLGEIPLETYGRVREARMGSDGLNLVLEGGQTVAADDVTALRAPV
ncbi:flagellar hook capping FlgD N-terminal domain-containing protein [Shimia aestuarii]|uniref:flagellar hook capping FlgD N-terminal domain-containing protein n=1 Tax=Shimia aestuarii TaxID=254406 RepID=UPI001FB4043B|nr:flagellar hook capping FlgD N-terminal domain-containing protein [Shimia aestuarii]